MKLAGYGLLGQNQLSALGELEPVILMAMQYPKLLFPGRQQLPAADLAAGMGGLPSLFGQGFRSWTGLKF
jgi:hypothetical protein